MAFTINTKTAVYEFNTAPGVIHVTKWILKGSGCKEAHCSTSTDLTSARKWIKQLKEYTSTK
jgi:hypothetical protein